MDRSLEALPTVGGRAHARRARLVAPLLAAVALLMWQLVTAPAEASAGDLDPSFGTGGKVTTDFDGNVDDAKAVAVQPDGRVVAAGVTVGDGTQDFALARYLAS